MEQSRYAKTLSEDLLQSLTTDKVYIGSSQQQTICTYTMTSLRSPKGTHLELLPLTYVEDQRLGFTFNYD